MVNKIISGGQTGADRGGLNAALALNISHGGWCPKGRIAEDGMIPDIYQLKEMESDQYPPRTRKNIQESDVTFIFLRGQMGPGTRLTIRLCRELRKPHVVIPLDKWSEDNVVKIIRQSLRDHDIINVAGSRESRFPGIQEQVERVLVRALS